MTRKITRNFSSRTAGPQPGYVQITQSASAGASVSVLDMSMAPGTGTPAHVHEQFAETFTVLAGALQVTLNGHTQTLRPGESATAAPGQSHGFLNKTADVCHIRVRIEPGNVPFEQAMQIYYGLMRDGLATRAGTPKRIGDLALFLHLNDSHLVGPARLVQPVFNWIARRNIRNGRLAELQNRYVTPTKQPEPSGNSLIQTLLVLVGLLVSIHGFGQSRFSKNELSINGFRAPSTGLEFRHRAVSVHAGYYITNKNYGCSRL